MQRRLHAASIVLLVPVALGLSGCAALVGEPDTKSDSLARVDELLTRVERVQVEALVSKERAHTALEALRSISAPDFAGDAQAAHGTLMLSIEQSQQQAVTLNASVAPLRAAAEAVFHSWTADLESFGNKGMRKRSQARLEETRTRCDAIVNALVAAQLSYDAFNADLHDQALFLANDFNAAAVAVIANDVGEMDEQVHELDGKLDACVAASKAYLESTALRGEMGAPSQTQAHEQTGDATQPRRVKRRAKTAPTTETTEEQQQQVSSATPKTKGTP